MTEPEQPETLDDLMAAPGPGSATVEDEIARTETVMREVAAEEGLDPPVYEVQVTRLVTFIVDVEMLRKDTEGFDDEEFDAQEAAEAFVDECEGVEVDNYATIHKVEPVPAQEGVR